ncbi:hypothetical protein D3C71_1753120 [compost metagenome]
MSDFSAVQSRKARPASLNDLIVISERRISGWTMIGSAFLSGALAPESERPWMRSLA